jgi:hypothetical protein
MKQAMNREPGARMKSGLASARNVRKEGPRFFEPGTPGVKQTVGGRGLFGFLRAEKHKYEGEIRG